MMTIQILGTGCPKCRSLADNAAAAIQRTGIPARVEKIDRLQDIIRLGVMSTPALAIDGRVKSAGRVLSPEEIGKLMQQEGATP